MTAVSCSAATCRQDGRWRPTKGDSISVAKVGGGRSAVIAALAVVVATTSSLADAAPIAENPTAAGVFTSRTFHDAAGSHRYQVWLPPGYTRDRRWPVLLFLHGAGERGRDGRRPTAIGLGPALAAFPQRFPCVVVFPQCEEDFERLLTSWSADRADGARALAILSEVERAESIDPQRRILAGWSMGGYGVWLLAAAQPEGFWQCALPLSAGGDDETAQRVPRALPVWAIHGADDRIVDPDHTRRLAAARTNAGGSVHATLIEGVGHDAWTAAFDHPDVARWLLDPAFLDPAAVEFSLDAYAQAREQFAEPSGPFVVAASVPQAVALRLGRAGLQSLADTVVESMQPESLAGQLDDIEQTAELDGQPLRARVFGLTRRAEMASVRLAPEGPERLRVQIGLRRLTLSAQGAEFSTGEWRGAAGPFEIVLGPWRPVWIDARVRPVARDGRLQFDLHNVEFSLPDDNWFVTAPEWTRATGPGLTDDQVETAVVGGLYRQRRRIEETIEAAIPELFRAIEDEAAAPAGDDLAGLIWPLPMAPPRMRLQPEVVRTDRNGVSLCWAIEIAAAATPTTERGGQATTRRLADSSSGRLLNGLGRIDEWLTPDITLGATPRTIEALSKTFVDSGEAHMDVLDAPEPLFHRLADRSLLAQAMPHLTSLATSTEFHTHLWLEAPFRVELMDGASRGAGASPDLLAAASGASAADVVRARLVVPHLGIEVFTRPQAGAGPWAPLAAFDLSLTQSMELSVADDADGRRRLSAAWCDDVQTIAAARKRNRGPGDSPDGHPDVLAAAFREAWRNWTMASPSPAPAPSFLPERLQLKDLKSAEDRFWLRLGE